MRLEAFPLLAFLALGPSVTAAQSWNDSAAVALVSRAVARRTVAQGDSGLRSWHVRAHGMVVFLAQVGEGGTGRPRLVKGDELDVEVYWSAPGRSKQVIRGWRDRRYLPTDVRYHRDHLGIVTDGYGPRIRIGEGDEVRDVVHPLSDEGTTHYEFLLRDSVTVTTAGRSVVLDVVDVRPRDPAATGVVGTISLDRATAELVRARWSFTPVSYLDRTVEELTVLLDYALIDGRFWLPYRQTIEIRRNAGWLDLPYTGIIRGTWDFGEYEIDPAIPPETFVGIPIGGLRQPGDSAHPWPAPFDSVMAEAGPVASEGEVVAARVEVTRAIEGRMARGLAPARVAAARLSDIVRYNRVQGVAVGAGMRVASRESRAVFRPSFGLGLADGRVTGGMDLTLRRSNSSLATLNFYATRSIRDFSDLPVISPTLNSFTAQESGDDHGDYMLVEGTGLRVEGPAGSARWSVHAGWEDPGPLGISATPARGTSRPQVDFGAPGYWTGGVTLVAGDEGMSGVRFTYDAGTGDEVWHRATLALEGGLPVHDTELHLRGYLGAASTGAPAWRTFVLGGRGTLLGEGYRKWGGRQIAWHSLEWRIPVPFPAIPLGDFANSGHQAVLAPFVSAGRADGRMSGLPWEPTDGFRRSAGVALELFYQLIRIEAGASLETGKVGVTFDVGRAWWGML
jgi:hypothetical protein